MSVTSVSCFQSQSSINDAAEFKVVADAMKVIGFKPEEIQTAYKILAAILHLVSGNAFQKLSPPCGAQMFFQKVWGFVKK